MKSKMRYLSIVLLAWVIVFASILQGCDLVKRENPLEPTLTALSGSVAQTMTAIQQSDTSSNSVATAQALATLQSLLLTPQAADSGAVSQQQREATAEASTIVAELPRYGLDASSGKAGWVHDPLKLEMSGYHDFAYGNDFMNVTAADFVLASDINWDTQYGGSGCGFMFRSNGNQNNPNQYLVLATRFAGGHVVFLALKDGKPANFHDFYPRDADRSFSAENGSTNRLAVVARDNLIEIYTNGVKIGEVDTTKEPPKPVVPARPKPPADTTDIPAVQAYQKQLQEYGAEVDQITSNYQVSLANYQGSPAVYTDGFLSMVAMSESGQTICNFNEAWLWLLDPSN